MDTQITLTAAERSALERGQARLYRGRVIPIICGGDHEVVREVVVDFSPEVRETLDGVKDAHSETQAKLDQLQRHYDELDIRFQKVGLSRPPGADSEIRAAGAPFGLERKFADVVQERGLQTRGQELDHDEMRLGALVAGMASKDAYGKLNDVEKRALGEWVLPSGGWLVDEVVSANVIDLARNKARVLEAGARTLLMEADTVHLPTLEGGVTPTWKPENAAVTEDEPTFGRVSMYSHTCAVLTKMSFELFQDMSAEAFALIEEELIAAISLAIDYAAIRGDGIGKPLGLRYDSEVTKTELGAGNGDTPTSYDDLLDAMVAIETANFEPTSLLWNATTANVYRKLATGISGDKTKLPPPPEVAALKRLKTEQLEHNLTVGSSSDCSEIVIGQFDQLAIGFRPEVGIKTLTLKEAFMGSNLQIGLLAWVRADTAILHRKAFHILTGVRD